MEKVKEFIFHKKVKFGYIAIPEFLLCLIFISSLFNVLYIKKINNIWSLKDLLLVGITGVASLLIIVKSFIDNKDKLEKVFVTIGTPLLIAYMIFVIPFKVPDENYHIYRAFNIARGDILISKEQNEETVPNEFLSIEEIQKYSDLFEVKSKNIHIPSNGEETKSFNAAQAYFPSIYIGPVIANIIGNIINLDVINLIYLMRIMNIIIYLVLGYYTIKFLPFGKLLMLVYLCIPMMLHQAASVSPDGFMNGMALLFIAYSMKLLFTKNDEAYTMKEKVIYFVLALLATLNKAAYMPLIFIAVLLIFNKKHPINKKDKIFMFATICIMVALTAGWYLIGNRYTDTRDIVVNIKGANSSEQLKFVMSNPKHFLKLLFDCLWNNKTLFTYQALGSQLGYLDINVDTFFTTFYLILLLFAPFVEKSEFKLAKFQKLWLLLITLGIASITCFAMYLGWSRPGLEFIDGVQGRYFLPVLILPLLCLIPKDNYLKFKHTLLVYPTLILIINFFFLDTIFKSLI